MPSGMGSNGTAPPGRCVAEDVRPFGESFENEIPASSDFGTRLPTISVGDKMRPSEVCTGGGGIDELASIPVLFVAIGDER